MGWSEARCEGTLAGHRWQEIYRTGCQRQLVPDVPSLQGGVAVPQLRRPEHGWPQWGGDTKGKQPNWGFSHLIGGGSGGGCAGRGGVGGVPGEHTGRSGGWPSSQLGGRGAYRTGKRAGSHAAARHAVGCHLAVVIAGAGGTKGGGGEALPRWAAGSCLQGGGELRRRRRLCEQAAGPPCCGGGSMRAVSTQQ